MPEMKTLTVNGVTYDVRDANALSASISALSNVSIKEWALSLKSSAYAYVDPTTKDMPVEVPSNQNYAIVSAKVIPMGVWVELRVTYVLTGCVAVLIYNNSWGEWEYLNPPMTPGVEYRTTERVNGKPVFVITKDIGALGNNSSVNILFDISYENVVHTEAIIYDPNERAAISLNSVAGNGSGGASARGYYSSNAYTIHSFEDMSHRTARVTIYYTK